MRTTGAIAIVLLALAACGSTDEQAAGGSPFVAQCVNRMIERVDGPPTRAVREYLRVTYCEPFTKKGWVHPDGTISIRAHEWILDGGTCEMAKGEPPTTTPCDARAMNEAPLLDCGLLHLVPRSEVRPYLEDLQNRRGRVRCDDGTPLDELGVA